MLTREERIASYRMSRGRRVVEYAFGIMASRFRVLVKNMEQLPETVREIVLSCVVLHNILRSQFNRQHGWQQPEDDEVVGDGQLVGGDVEDGHDKNPAREPKRQRDYLRDYFNNKGTVAYFFSRTAKNKSVLFRATNYSNQQTPKQTNPSPNKLTIPPPNKPTNQPTNKPTNEQTIS